MRKKIVLLLLILISSFSHSMQLSSCAAQSSKINRDLPVWVDKVTMFLSTRCEQKGDKVVMHYGMKVMMNRQQIPKAAMERIKLNVKNEACSRPDSKAFLRTDDIQYDYLDADGVSFDYIKISSEDCR